MGHWNYESVDTLVETGDGDLLDELFGLDSSFVVGSEENLDDGVELHVHLKLD